MIREQIEGAEATVAREIAEFEARYPPEAFVHQELEPIHKDEQPAKPEEPLKDPQQQQPKSMIELPPAPEPDAKLEEAQKTTDEVGAQTNEEQTSDVARTDTTPTNGTDTAAHEQADAHHDDGGEVVEDNEDTVIY